MSSRRPVSLVVPAGVLWLTALLVLAAGCDEDPQPPPSTPAEDAGGDAAEDVGGDVGGEDAADDVGADVVEEPACEEVDPAAPGRCLTPAQGGITPEGLDVLVAAGEGEVRLGVVSDETGGMGGVESTCKRGDYVLVNRLARFCVEGQLSSNRLFFDGGRLVDAEPVDAPTPAGQTGRDRLDVLSPFVSLQVGSAERIEIVRDGSDGQLAVLRVSGVLEPSAYLAGIVGPSLFQRRALSVVTEYRLRPERRDLEVVTFMTNTGASSMNIQSGDLLFWGDTIQSFFPGSGSQPPPGAQAVLGFGAGVAYGMVYDAPFTSVEIPGLSLPASPLLAPLRALPSQAEAVLLRRFVVAPDVAGLLDVIATTAPEHPLAQPYVEASAVVTEGGAPSPGALVQVTPLGEDGTPGALWMADRADEAGRVRLRLPAGRYQVLAVGALGQELGASLDTADAAREVTLALPGGGAVRVAVEAFEGEAAPAPSPARLIFRQEGQAERRVMVLRGERTVRLPAGRWSYEVSRGLEYTAVQGEVEVTEGGEASLEATLERVVPTPGFVSGEFHQHATASLDSEVPVVERVLSNIVEGVDFAVASDHDIATEFQPVIEELGAQDLIASLAGTEVSPLFGHFGAYPVRADRYLPGRGALILSYKDASGAVARYENGEELIAAMRDELGAELIQSNHPRDSTGYFDDFNWDREQPVSSADPGFSVAFDTMEVINGPECEQLRDWFALLNQGYRVVGVGNSDTHNLSSPAGFPRNYLPAPSDAPAELTERQIIDGIKSGDSVISASAWLEFGPDRPGTPGGRRPGQLIPGGSIQVEVRALTPPWAEVNHLVVIRNGEVIERLEIGAGEAEIVDFDAPVTLEVGDEGDAWFVIIAYGDRPASAVYPGRQVFAIANPFFLDSDENGVFDAPGPGPLPAEGIPLCD